MSQGQGRVEGFCSARMGLFLLGTVSSWAVIFFRSDEGSYFGDLFSLLLGVPESSKSQGSFRFICVDWENLIEENWF